MKRDKRFKGLFGQCIKYSKHNLLNVLVFELLFNILVKYLIFPVFTFILRLAVNFSGTAYISQANASMLINPMSVIVILLCLFIAGFLIYFEINALVINYRFYDVNLKYWQLALFSLKQSVKIFHPKNWIMLLLVLLVIPLRSGMFVTYFARIIKLPGFIAEYIESNSVLSVVYLALLVLFYIILMFGCFVFHEMSEHNYRFLDAYKSSFNLIKKHFFRTIITIFVSVTLIEILVNFIGTLLLFGYAFILKSSFDVETANSIFLDTYIYISYACDFFGYLISIILQFATVSRMYYAYRGVPIVPIVKYKRPLFTMFLAIFSSMLIVVMSFVQVNQIFERKNNLTVSAHRAGAMYAPENTLPAIRSAIALEADYAEIDVQQLKDGNLIIAHDTNFMRIAGVDKNVWDVTLNTLKTYDAGRYFSDDYKGTTYPTLDEFLSASKDKIKLIIELKSSGHENQLEKKTIDAVKKYGMENQVIIASMDTNIIANSKKIAPEITTQLISAVALGDYTKLENADILSIEETFATKKLVDDLHSRDKQVFVWTVNDRSNVRDMIELGVDSILSDDILMVYGVIAGFSGNDIVDIISTDYILGDEYIKNELESYIDEYISYLMKS